jgi:serine phosphatase RsbU (regulator of sigma subunit)
MIDQITVPVVTLLFITFLYLPLKLLLIYGGVATASYILLLTRFLETRFDVTVNMAAIMLSIIVLGFSFNRFIKTIKRKEFIHKLTIEELNSDLKTEIEERVTIQNNLETVLKEITDSIRYAQKIQFALLPDESILNRKFKESALLFMPKNIVSGDFYWIYEAQNKTIIALADCTGHGIPGAFMSVLGISLLNDIVKNEEEANSNIKSDRLLCNLRESVIRSLQHSVVNYDRRDGMDIAMIIVDHKQKSIQFSGAYMPLWLVRKNGSDDAQLIEYAGDKMSVGLFSLSKTCNYSTKVIEYKDDDIVYLFSDGFRDQFGGEKGKKFLAKRMRRMFLDNYDVPLEKQQELWKEYYRNWKGNREQVDDILVMGLKL